MAEIHDFNDQFARHCSCGSVNFNLLKSRKVECSRCGAVVDGIYWQQFMEESHSQFDQIASDNKPANNQ